MLAEIHVSPRPSGTPQERYAHVDAAIAVVQASGLEYEVHALGTVIQGPPETLWPLFREVHEATLAAGADHTMTTIRLAEAAGDAGPGIVDLVAKFRP